MIISPPFLPPTIPAQPAAEGSTAATPAATPQSDADWVEDAMKQPPSRAPASSALEGSYPLSAALMWHNGIHIEAPRNSRGVRAIADGKVIYAKEGAKPDEDTEHPQNYNPFGKAAAWTDNGIVIIEHETDIGATVPNTATNATAQPTAIKFYSTYLHLRTQGVNPRTKVAWKAGDRIYRKEVLGDPGQVYGHEGQIHFEISCDETNLEALIGRKPRWVEIDAETAPPAPTADGRKDTVFGDIFVYLPKGTPTCARGPAGHLRAPGDGNLDEPQWVALRYDKGTAFLRGFDALGNPIGTERFDESFEYDLYRQATERHKDVVKSSLRGSSPSGWYELLRFGRKLGPDPLPEEMVAHWRKVPTPTGELWVDLNAKGTFKFSDADFLPVTGWNCFDDDSSPNDQRCDSVNLKRWIRDPDLTNANRMSPTALSARLGEASVSKKLRRAICKFPSEWDRSNIEQRHEWLRDPSLPWGLNEDKKWTPFARHCRAMSFEDLPTAYLGAQWRFHPTEFITVMRRCGWLSAMELAQCFPRSLKHLVGTSFHATEVGWRTAYSRAETWLLPFNLANRKYHIDTRQRLTHYFSHVVPETGYLAMMKEADNAAGTYLRGKPYYPYYGRGLIQLTWDDTYLEYGKYRSFSKTEQPQSKFGKVGWNPDIHIAQTDTNFNASNCADSAGFYISRRAGMLNKMDSGITLNDAIAVSRCVNGSVSIEKLNGLDARLQSLLCIRDVLLDFPAENTRESLTFEWRRNSAREATGQLSPQGNPVKQFVKRSWTIEVFLDKQRP